jgi:hypothetical protein
MWELVSGFLEALTACEQVPKIGMVPDMGNPGLIFGTITRGSSGDKATLSYSVERNTL